MRWLSVYKENRNGFLYFDGVNMDELAHKYGTPAYVMSVNEIEDRIREFRECFLNKYENTRLAYASKAFLPLAMCRIIQREELSLDVVSGGELYTALKAGFPSERIEFNGNNKSFDELTMAVENKVGRIIIDSTDELNIIENICAQKGKRVGVMYRVNPGVDAHTHQYMTTGNKDSKFGIDIDGNRLLQAVEEALCSKYVEFFGFHFHVGAGLYENEPYLNALDKIKPIISEVKKKYGYDTKEINIGGGFAATFVSERQRPPYAYYLHPIMKKIEEIAEETGIKRPTVVIEPGRAITAEAGITLYTIGSIKNIEGVRKYIAVDGGMTDNIRVALYGAQYEGCIANKLNDREKEMVTVCGKCCESGDIIARDIYLPKAERGDIFALYSTGCYCYAMSSNYNKIPKPPVVLVKDGKDQLIVRRQSYDEMICDELLPYDIL